jgi:hypothetical protein
VPYSLRCVVQLDMTGCGRRDRRFDRAAWGTDSHVTAIADSRKAPGFRIRHQLRAIVTTGSPLTGGGEPRERGGTRRPGAGGRDRPAARNCRARRAGSEFRFDLNVSGRALLRRMPDRTCRVIGEGTRYDAPERIRKSRRRSGRMVDSAEARGMAARDLQQTSRRLRLPARHPSAGERAEA